MTEPTRYTGSKNGNVTRIAASFQNELQFQAVCQYAKDKGFKSVAEFLRYAALDHIRLAVACGQWDGPIIDGQVRKVER